MSRQPNQRKTAMTISQKIDALNAFEQKRATIKQLQLQYSCGKTQIYDLIKHKDRLRREWSLTGISAFNNCQRRRSRSTANDALNHAIYRWYQQQNAAGTGLVTGVMLQAYAMGVAQRLGRPEFKASNGWLASFQRRHNVQFGQRGRRDSVAAVAAADVGDALSGSDVEHQTGEDYVADVEGAEDSRDTDDDNNWSQRNPQSSDDGDDGDDDDDEAISGDMEHQTGDPLFSNVECVLNAEGYNLDNKRRISPSEVDRSLQTLKQFAENCADVQMLETVMQLERQIERHARGDSCASYD